MNINRGPAGIAGPLIIAGGLYAAEYCTRLAAGLFDDGGGQNAVAVALLRLHAGGNIACKFTQFVHHVVRQLFPVRQFDCLTAAAYEPDAADMIDIVEQDRTVLAHECGGSGLFADFDQIASQTKPS